MNIDQLEDLSGKAGMYTDLMRMGAASLVYSPGCEGVNLTELERFVELVESAVLARAAAQLEALRAERDAEIANREAWEKRARDKSAENAENVTGYRDAVSRLVAERDAARAEIKALKGYLNLEQVAHYLSSQITAAGGTEGEGS